MKKPATTSAAAAQSPAAPRHIQARRRNSLRVEDAEPGFLEDDVAQADP